jgi:hypothetical protein
MPAESSRSKRIPWLPTSRMRLGSMLASLLVFSGCAVMKDAYRVDPLLAERAPDCRDRAIQFAGWALFGASRSDPVTEDQLMEFGALGVSRTQAPPCWPDGLFFEEPSPVTLAQANADEAERKAPVTSGTASTQPEPPPDVVSPIKSYYRAWRSPSSSQEAKIARNELIWYLVGKSDQICEDHVARFIGQEAANKLFFGTAAIVSGGIGSVVTAAAAANTWSALAGGFGGLTALISESVYYKQLTPVIAAATRAEQLKLLDEIRAHTELEPDDYTLRQGVSEVIAYHETCSFANGLTILQHQLVEHESELDKAVQQQVTKLAQEGLVRRILAKVRKQTPDGAQQFVDKAIDLELAEGGTTDATLGSELSKRATGDATKTDALSELLAFEPTS